MFNIGKINVLNNDGNLNYYKAIVFMSSFFFKILYLKLTKLFMKLIKEIEEFI